MSHLKSAAIKLAVLITLLSTSAFTIEAYAQQSYQTELVAFYEKQDDDTTTSKTLELTATYFLEPVNTDNKPLAEAAYLNKSSSIAASYLNRETKFENANVDTFDTDLAGLMINYVTAADSFILGGLYASIDYDTNNDFVTGDGDLYGISLGKYLDNSTSIELSIIKNNSDQQTTLSQFKIRNTFIAFNYKTIEQLASGDFYGFSANVELIKQDVNSVKADNREISIAGDYYFTLETSLGASLTLNSGDDASDEGKTFAINTTHFFNPRIALYLELSRFSADNNLEEDNDSVAAAIVARF